MFIKQAKVEDRNKKALEVGRSLEIHLENGRRIDGIVDFISLSHGAHNIFIDGNNKNRTQLKIYSNRTLIELVVYSEDQVGVYKVKEVTVMSQGKQEKLHTSQADELNYWTDEKTTKLVPVEVGDVFGKHDKEFRVLAIARNGGTMFMEDTISGDGITVNLNDDVLIRTFRGFTWGNPTR